MDLIGGNGRFPILALETARSLGHEIVAVGIQEEASRDIEPLAARTLLDFAWRTQQADRHPEERRHHRDHDDAVR